MNDPNSDLLDAEADLSEQLQAEFLELMGIGDRKAFDFAMEYSDKANYAQQAMTMSMMKAAGHDYQNLPLPARAPALAIMAVCARQAFLDVIASEAAPLWAQHELPKRLAEFGEMRAEREEPELIS